MNTALYIIWFSLPGIFFLMALWSLLEKVGARGRMRDKPGEYFKQGLFVLACAGVTLLVDTYLLESLVGAISSEWLPLEFFRVMLMPFVLFIGAKVVGGSAPVLVQRGSQEYRSKQNRK